MKHNYTTIEAVFHNSLILHLEKLEFTIANTACSLSYLPDCPSFSPALSLNFNFLQENNKADFFDLSFLSLHKDTSALDNFEELPSNLKQAIAEFVFEDILSALSKQLEMPITFLSSAEPVDESNLLYPFSFNFTFLDKSCPITLYLTSKSLEACLPSLKKLPKKKQDLSTIALACTVQIGSVDLSLSALQNLEAGDVILPDTLTYTTKESNDNVAVFTALGMSEYNNFPQFLCTIENSMLTLKQIYSPIEEKNMSEENQIQSEIQENIPQEEAENSSSEEKKKEQSAIQESNFSDIKVKLVFELERRMMSISELQNLHVGTNILLESDKNSPITLMLSDTAFAKARFVDIDGQYGLQLTEILVKKD